MTNPFQYEASIRADKENFDERLRFGQAGEREITSRLKRAGYNVLEPRLIVPESGSIPTISTPSTNLTVADLFVWRGEVCRWIEVKRKSAFAWYRKKQCWVTGINRHQYRDYQAIEKNSPWPVWLFLLHDGGFAKGSPFADSPAGLFGNPLSYLTTNEDHQAPQWGMSGMVYWAIDKLEPLDREANRSMERFNLRQPKKTIHIVSPEPRREPEQLLLEGF
jgi:hypothetical protein